MVITDRIENVDHLGFFIYRLCHDKETYKLQRRETIRGKGSQIIPLRLGEKLKGGCITWLVFPGFRIIAIPSHPFQIETISQHGMPLLEMSAP